MHAQVHLQGGELHIDREGRSRKFKAKVQQKTFAASSANGRPIMYVTERAVFKLIEGKGLELVEVAPGVTRCTQFANAVQLLLVVLPMVACWSGLYSAVALIWDPFCICGRTNVAQAVMHGCSRIMAACSGVFNAA